MKVKKVSNLNRKMCHEIRNELDIISVHAHFSRNRKSCKNAKLRNYVKSSIFVPIGFEKDVVKRKIL